MKKRIDHAQNYLSIVKKRDEEIDKIDKQRATFQRTAIHKERVIQAREFYAASLIAALIRGYLDRVTCRKLRRYHRAVLLIQRLMKGKLGRIRWQREYWRSVSVVKSDHALAELLDRSKLLREQPDGMLSKRRKEHWKEYFDPLTNSFWYFNAITAQNTWQVPFCFQKDLVCTWQGYEEFGGLPQSTPCRAVFSTVEEYQRHQRTAHRWYCTACFQCNSGLLFPTCPLCNNKYSSEGSDGERALRESLDQVHNRLERFLSRDMNPTLHGASYSLKNRLIDITAYRHNSLESLEKILEEGDEQKETKKSRLEAVNEHYLRHRGDNYSQVKAQANKITDMLLTTTKDDKMADKKQKSLHVMFVTSAPMPQQNVDPFPDPSLYNTVNLEVQRRAWKESGGLKGEKERYEDPALRGLFSAQDFELITAVHDDDIRARAQLDLLEDTSDESDAEDAPASSDKLVKSLVKPLEERKKTTRLLVCQRFLDGQCSLTTCPFAHPGLRDEAKIRTRIQQNPDGSKKRLSYVVLCEESGGLLACCPDGRSCRNYHIYVRPSTEEIITSLYPISSGHKRMDFPSGARLLGNAVNNVFQGYGSITWPDGSIFLGDWKDGKRHGKGIYRSSQGLEYVGEFCFGLRHGWGVLSAPSGEEYIGQWKEGKMDGVGQLNCANGDKYLGYFYNNQYEGIGFFRKADGDTYMGFFKNSQAHGLGVLSLSTGEKYKGYFEFNARHGQGVCIYPNQCKYSGYWYRGVHEGFGIFLSPSHGQYIGHWQANKKHGKGRYIFNNLDFYDGDFVQNKAEGFGVYYHANGNIYSGQWSNDMRNGKGTYCFVNGSKYTGYWLNNDIHNKGRFDFANGAYYRGNFDHNTKHGKGIYTWANGAVYKGDFFREKLHGKGEMQYIHGHRYIGDWADNKKHGQGILYYANGAIYEGDFCFDGRVGYGKLTLMPNTPAEEIYEGDWKDDCWHGKGRYAYRKDEGMVYVGEWEKGLRQGRGLLTFKDGSYYRGDFRKDQMWGKGVFIGADGSQYDGEWRANMRQGMGTSIESDGSVYHGEFFGNMKQGNGKLIRNDGSVYEGQWDAGIVIGTGKMTITVGDKTKMDGLPKQITLKVFGY